MKGQLQLTTQTLEGYCLDLDGFLRIEPPGARVRILSHLTEEQIATVRQTLKRMREETLTYGVKWDGSRKNGGTTSGAYIYCIEAGTQVVSKLLIFL